MIAFLNQNDLDNLKLAIDKMKSEDFDAARKMELLVAAYEAQDGDGSDLEQFREEIESLPGWSSEADHLEHVRNTADMLYRALDTIQAWEDSKDGEPLDEAVKRLVQIAEEPDPEAEKLAEVLDRIVAVVDRGDSDALTEALPPQRSARAVRYAPPAAPASSPTPSATNTAVALLVLFTSAGGTVPHVSGCCPHAELTARAFSSAASRSWPRLRNIASACA